MLGQVKVFRALFTFDPRTVSIIFLEVFKIQILFRFIKYNVLVIIGAHIVNSTVLLTCIESVDLDSNKSTVTPCQTEMNVLIHYVRLISVSV